jgi:hypothetical protein
MVTTVYTPIPGLHFSYPLSELNNVFLSPLILIILGLNFCWNAGRYSSTALSTLQWPRTEFRLTNLKLRKDLKDGVAGDDVWWPDSFCNGEYISLAACCNH